MDKKIAESIKEAWEDWGKEKPWYCPKCDILLNKSFFPECSGGSHPYKPTVGYMPDHTTIKAKRSVTFEEFCTIMFNYYKTNP